MARSNLGRVSAQGHLPGRSGGVREGFLESESIAVKPSVENTRGVTWARSVPGSLPGPVLARAQAYLAAVNAPSTRRAYRSDWSDFGRWCGSWGAASLPAVPETVALYLAARAVDHRPATLTRRLTAIAKAHEAAGFSSPATVQHAAVSETLKGIRRIHGTAQRGKAPLVTADLQKILAHLDPGPHGDRDRALLLVGYCRGFRRSCGSRERLPLRFRLGARVPSQVRDGRLAPQRDVPQRAGYAPGSLSRFKRWCFSLRLCQRRRLQPSCGRTAARRPCCPACRVRGTSVSATCRGAALWGCATPSRWRQGEAVRQVRGRCGP